MAVRPSFLAGRAVRKLFVTAAGVAASVALFFLFGEAFARLTGSDVILMRKLIQHMPLHPRTYVASADPLLVYELKPGSKTVYDRDSAHIFRTPQSVTINSLGFRGTERSARKPPGARRVVCVGASTVYGHAVNDDETYPHYLGEYLTRALGRPVEALNGGLAGSVLRQQVRMARRGVELYEADTVIFLVTNSGRRSMLADEPIEPLFRKDPSLFAENMRYLPLRDRAFSSFLLSGSYFWRTLAAAANYLITVPQNNPGMNSETLNEAALTKFCREFEDRVDIFVVPGPNRDINAFGYAGVPVIRLFDPKNLPPGAGRLHFDLHPPPDVYEWYARVIGEEVLKAWSRVR